MFFLFPYQNFCKSEKLVRLHQQAFIVYKILKMLMETFSQKFIVSNVILSILDDLKPKLSSSAIRGGQHERHSFSNSLNS